MCFRQDTLEEGTPTPRPLPSRERHPAGCYADADVDVRSMVVADTDLSCCGRKPLRVLYLLLEQLLFPQLELLELLPLHV